MQQSQYRRRPAKTKPAKTNLGTKLCKSIQAGFTLIEVLIAVAITATVMMTVGTTFHALLDARQVIDELSESTEAGPRILNLIERDLRGLWTYNVGNNAVFRGRDMDVGSFEADRMDFLTTTDAVGFVLDAHGEARQPSLCEVGYWFKQNPRYRDLIEMWRREDPLIDDDIITQGSFQLVHNRIKSFKVTYFTELGYEAEELLEWDSSEEDKLPRRIKIEFTIERRRGSRNVVNSAELNDFESAEKTYVRHFVFDDRMNDILRAGTAMIPVLPIAPEAQEGGAGLGEGGPGAQESMGAMGQRPIAAGENRPGQRGNRGDRQGGKGERGGERGGNRGGNRGSATQIQSGNRSTPQNLPQGFNLQQLFGNGAGGFGGLFGNQ